LHAGTAKHPDVRLHCPRGLRVADLLPARGTSLTLTYGAGTIIGASRAATIVFEPLRLRRAQTAYVAILCKRPAPDGSLLARRGPRAGRLRWVTRDHVYVRTRAGGDVGGSVRRGQPVHVAGRGSWVRIVTDGGLRGWVPSRVLSARRPG
jgi:hypothetical protein